MRRGGGLLVNVENDFPFLSFPSPSATLIILLHFSTSQLAAASLHHISYSSTSSSIHHTMAPSSDHTIEETAEAYAHLHLQPHEKTSPNVVPRSAHTHASQQAVNVPSP